MIMSVTSEGEKVIKNMIDSGIGRFEESVVSDYFSVQYPENISIPMYREEMINDIKNTNKSLKKIYNHYMYIDDLVAVISKVKRKALRR